MSFFDLVIGNIISLLQATTLNILMVAIFLKWRFLWDKKHIGRMIFIIMSIILFESIIGTIFYQTGVFHWKYNIGKNITGYMLCTGTMLILRQLYRKTLQNCWMAAILLFMIDSLTNELIESVSPNMFFHLDVLSERIAYMVYLYGLYPAIELLVIFLLNKTNVGKLVRHWIDYADLHLKSVLFLSFYTALTTGILALLNLGDKIGNRASLIILIMLFSFYIFYTYMWREELQQQKLNVQQISLHQQRAYIENLENLQKEMRRFRHDYKNMMSGMYFQAKEGNFKAIQDFIQDMTDEFDSQVGKQIQVLTQLCNIHMPEVKGLLLSKLETMEREQIHCELEVLYPFHSASIKATDLCRCLGILIDNAIEEVKGKDNPEIHIMVSSQKGHTTFRIKNILYSKVDFHKIWQEGFSTKGADRGIGLTNYKRILERYENISSLTTIHEGYFIQELKIQD